jgi:hypothetical protein
LRGRRLSGIPTPGPSAPMNNNAGFGGNNAFSGVASAARNYDLTANGRNLSQLTPGIAAEAGAAAGTGAGARMASKPAQWAVADAKKQSEANFGLDEVAQDGFAKKDELAKKREGSRAKEKAMTLEVGSASETAQVSAPAPSVLSPATAGAMTAAPARREGEIRGVVRDASGAAISGAKVTVTNTATGSSVVSSTDSAGIYAVAAAPVGPYTVAVTKAGFQTFVRQGVNLEPPTVAVNATLQVGATSSAVTVEAQDVAVDTTSATASTTTAYAPTNKDDFRASSAEISNLPGLATARQAGTWQVTDSGNLQRSLDGGKSWKNVSLSASTRLRVVTATGFQVWAGGNGGVLFHSRDAGGHFAAVKVHKKHVTLAGDIVTLAFADARHGRLETADHEVWTTTDGGKTWLPAAPVK